jgi:purine-binding chemotaxis protein CheW
MTATLQETTPSDSRCRGGPASVQLVGFRLAEEEYAVEIAKVREIILPEEITRVPQTPAYLKGLINLRSTVIPVVDLRLRFGFDEREPTDSTRVVVVNIRGKTMGLIVDAVSEVLRVARDQIAAPPPTVAAPERQYLTGLVKLENRLLILLDVDKILNDDETIAAENEGASP